MRSLLFVSAHVFLAVVSNIPGKKPASKIPRSRRSGIKVVHSFTNANSIMTAPQMTTMDGRNSFGPSFRSTTVAGGWSATYVMKNNRTTVLYLSLVSFRSTPMPATIATPRFVLSMSDTQYMKPRVGMSRRSTLRIIFFCSSGVNRLMAASLDEILDSMRSMAATSPFSSA